MSIASKVLGICKGVFGMASIAGATAFRQPTTPDATAEVLITASAAARKGLVVQQAAGQTANAIEVQDPAGIAGLRILIDPSGGQVFIRSQSGKSIVFNDDGSSVIIRVINFDDAGKFVASEAGAGNNPPASVNRLYLRDANLGNTAFLSPTSTRRLSADVPNATTTFSNLTDLSLSGLVSGQRIVGRVVVKCNNSLAADGIKFDFNGGTATMSSFWAAAKVHNGSVTIGNEVVSTLAGVINYTVLTGTNFIVIEFAFVTSSTGTFIMRFAGNAAVSGTATVEIGSSLIPNDSTI